LTLSFHYANIIVGFQIENIMHLISAGKLKQAASKYPDASKPIQAFCKIIQQAQWQNLLDVQRVYRDAEAVGNFTVFNLKGNKYRLIIDVDYSEQVAYFKYFLTHAQYDQEKWKNDPYY
jgi:mRNA interferase HigB